MHSSNSSHSLFRARAAALPKHAIRGFLNQPTAMRLMSIITIITTFTPCAAMRSSARYKQWHSSPQVLVRETREALEQAIAEYPGEITKLVILDADIVIA